MASANHDGNKWQSFDVGAELATEEK